MVKVMGMLTLETVPGLNRHCRNALVAALSRIGLPVLDETLQLVTLPLPDSTEPYPRVMPPARIVPRVQRKDDYPVDTSGKRRTPFLHPHSL